MQMVRDLCSAATEMSVCEMLCGKGESARKYVGGLSGLAGRKALRGRRRIHSGRTSSAAESCGIHTTAGGPSGLGKQNSKQASRSPVKLRKVGNTGTVGDPRLCSLLGSGAQAHAILKLQQSVEGIRGCRWRRCTQEGRSHDCRMLKAS